MLWYTKHMKLLAYLLINSVAIIVAANILPGVRVDSFTSVIILAIVLGVINTFIKPLVLLFTLPINLVTLGLFTFVVNALLVLLADLLVGGFAVNNFLWALLFSLVVSLVSSFLNLFARK